jgi:hypothetical protein
MRMIKHKKRLREAALDNIANQRAVQIKRGAHTRVILGHLNACGPSKGVSKRAYSHEVQRNRSRVEGDKRIVLENHGERQEG